EPRNVDLADVAERDRRAVVDALAVDRGKPGDDVVHVAGEKTDLARHPGLAERHAEPSGIGDAAGGWTEAGDTAEGGGNAHRAADIAAEAERRSAGSNDGALAAAAAARGALGIPGIVG